LKKRKKYTITFPPQKELIKRSKFLTCRIPALPERRLTGAGFFSCPER
jgi:hypothetical protein